LKITCAISIYFSRCNIQPLGPHTTRISRTA
jgi:hypothetical protein